MFHIKILKLLFWLYLIRYSLHFHLPSGEQEQWEWAQLCQASPENVENQEGWPQLHQNDPKFLIRSMAWKNKKQSES